jgi:hypothetical protein
VACGSRELTRARQAPGPPNSRHAKSLIGERLVGRTTRSNPAACQAKWPTPSGARVERATQTARLATCYRGSSPSLPCLFVPAHCGGQPPPFALACSATRACAGSLSRWMSAAAPPHTAPRAAKASSGCRHLASETPKKVLLGVERPSHDKAIEPFEGRPEPLSGSACEGCPSAPTHGLVPERRRHGRRPGAG